MESVPWVLVPQEQHPEVEVAQVMVVVRDVGINLRTEDAVVMMMAVVEVEVAA